MKNFPYFLNAFILGLCSFRFLIREIYIKPRKISKFRWRGNPSILITVKFNPIKVVMLAMFRNYSSPCHLSLIESFVLHDTVIHEQNVAQKASIDAEAHSGF